MAGHEFWTAVRHFSEERLWIPRSDVYLALYLVVFLSLLAGTSCVFYRLTLHPLVEVPGPRLASISGLWRSKRYFDGTWHKDILHLHEKYGRVVRIAPNEVSVVDESAMKRLYGHGHNAPKTKWYSVWDPPVKAPQLFSELDPKTHSFLRRRLASAYSMTAVLKYETYIQACLDNLINKLRDKAEQGRPENMSDWTNALAFDVVGELGYGKELGHVSTETDVFDLRKTIFGIFFLSSNLGHFPGQLWIISNPVSRFLASTIGGPNPMDVFQKWTAQQVQYRLDNIDNNMRSDLLSHFCRMKDANGEPASFDEIFVEALNLIGAGADTTSIGMRACLYYLATHLTAYQRIQAEVDALVRDKQFEGPITYLQTQQMPLLQAVIKESTRLHPSIVYQLIRQTPANFQVRGLQIPEGTTVGISPLAQNRDKDIWGQDADNFRPERWIENPEKTKYFDSNTMTFGGNGPRMCIGRNIALVELHKFLAQFVQHFDFDLVDKQRPWKIKTYWFAYQHEMMMNISLRDGHSRTKK